MCKLYYLRKDLTSVIIDCFKSKNARPNYFSKYDLLRVWYTEIDPDK